MELPYGPQTEQFTQPMPPQDPPYPNFGPSQDQYQALVRGSVVTPDSPAKESNKLSMLTDALEQHLETDDGANN
jgi:hypothetical protein